MVEKHGDWTALFSRTILGRGKCYYQSGKAKKLRPENDGYSVTVRGTRNYTVRIVMAGTDELGMLSCTCPHAAGGNYCKHMAAALFYLEQYLGEPVYLPGDDADSPEDFAQATGLPAGTAAASAQSSKPAGTAAASAQSSRPAGTAAASGTSSGSTSAGRTPHTSDKEYFPDLAALQAQEMASRTDDAPASSFIPSDYRYFNGSTLLSDMKIKAADNKKAQALLKNKSHNQIQVRLGYREGTGSEELIGEAVWSTPSDYYYEDNLVRLTFNREHILSSTCSGWRCRNARYYGEENYACEHQIAALCLLQEYLKTNNPGDSTNLAGLYFLTGITGDIKAETSDSVPTLTIIPYLTRDENGLYACFRVGAGKLYKIKNLPEFAAAVANGDRMRFGTKTDLTLGREHILPESVKWMTFIDNFLAREKVQLDQFSARLRYNNPELFMTSGSCP